MKHPDLVHVCHIGTAKTSVRALLILQGELCGETAFFIHRYELLTVAEQTEVLRNIDFSFSLTVGHMQNAQKQTD